jgi:hypothetical protein
MDTHADLAAPATGTDADLATLPVFGRFEDVADAARYRPLPDGWALALGDVVGSTAAIASGSYKQVNMAGAAVISSVLNAAGGTRLPFVFGGDGACVAVPPAAAAAAEAALAATGAYVAEELGLDLRTALVPVTAIRAAGQDVRVARFGPSELVSYAMFAGGGTSWAEAEMKRGHFAVARAAAGTRPDLTGLSCRWSPVAARRGVIVSLIVMPGTAGGEGAFRDLVTDVARIAAEEERAGNPVPPEGPALRLSGRGLTTEVRMVRGALARMKRAAGVGLQAALMLVLHRLNRPLGGFDARLYASDIALNADFRKFDDGLKMTVDVSTARLGAIEARLRAAAAAGICRYGLHRQDSALMTCIVPTPMGRDHMHFIDGAAGGYAAAAQALKAGT